MADILQVTIDGVLREQWDDNPPRTYTRWDPTGVLVDQRPYNPTENADADIRAIDATRSVNQATLADTSLLTARLSRLAAYEQDPEIVAALARPNATAPTTQELNRLLKVMLRRDRRMTAALALLVRLLDPDLLDDIDDTNDP